MLELTISCVKDRDSTTVPQRHSQQRRWLKWSLFMLQWFLRFSEFAGFTELKEIITVTWLKLFFRCITHSSFFRFWFAKFVNLFEIFVFYFDKYWYKFHTWVNVEINTRAQNFNGSVQISTCVTYLQIPVAK